MPTQNNYSDQGIHLIDQDTLEQDQLWDADQVKYYQNLQNFYNNSYFGYGLVGNQTHFNPRTQQNQIQSSFDYTKENAKQHILVPLLTLGGEQLLRWGFTPVEIGSGAEAIVSSAPLSSTVTKVTTIPRAEMHIRNMIPGAVKSTFVKRVNNLNTYTQNKVRILSKDQLQKALQSLEKIMNKKGWTKVTHPNLDGIGFTNGRFVVSDLGEGNVGRDIFGRTRLTDFTVETVPEFKAAMERKGGILK